MVGRIITLQLSIVVSIAYAKSDASDLSGSAVKKLSTTHLPDSELLTMLYFDTTFEQYFLPGPMAVIASAKLMVVSAKKKIPLKNAQESKFKYLESRYLNRAVDKIAKKAWLAFETAESNMIDINGALSNLPEQIEKFLLYLTSKNVAVMANFQPIYRKEMKDSLNDCIRHAKKIHSEYDVLVKMLGELCEGLTATGKCSAKRFVQVRRGRNTNEQKILVQTFENFEIPYKEIVLGITPSGSLLGSNHTQSYFAIQRVSTLHETPLRRYDMYSNGLMAANLQLRATRKRLSLLNARSTSLAEIQKHIESATSAILNLRKQFGRLVKSFEVVSGVLDVTLLERTANFVSKGEKAANNKNTERQFLNSDFAKMEKAAIRVAAMRILAVKEYLTTLSWGYFKISQKYTKKLIRALETIQNDLKGFARAKLKEVSNKSKREQKSIKAFADKIRKPFKKAVEKSKRKIKEVYMLWDDDVLEDRDKTI